MLNIFKEYKMLDESPKGKALFLIGAVVEYVDKKHNERLDLEAIKEGDEMLIRDSDWQRVFISVANFLMEKSFEKKEALEKAMELASGYFLQSTEEMEIERANFFYAAGKSLYKQVMAELGELLMPNPSG